MAVPAGIERKVRQLDNDVQSIYEMLAEISGTQRRHGNRLDEIDGRLAAMDARFDGIDGRLDGIDGRLDGLQDSVTRIEGTLDTVLELLRERPPGR